MKRNRLKKKDKDLNRHKQHGIDNYFIRPHVEN